MADGAYVGTADLIRIVGVAKALQCATAFGGRAIYVPKRVDETHPIAQAIGLDAARKISEEWKGICVTFPRCTDWLRRETHRSIQLDYGHLSARKAAIKWQMTERNIFRIWAAGRSRPSDARQR